MHRRAGSLVALTLVGSSAVVGCYHESDVAPRQDSAGTDTDTDATTETAPSSGASSSDEGSSDPTATDATGGECMLDAECKDDDACTLDVCDEHVCEHVPLDGVPVVEQVAGDCRTAMCVVGVAEPVPDPEDLPDDDNDCTLDTCDGIDAVHAPDELGAPCGDAGSCDGAGVCLECLSPDDCDHLPPDDDCAVRTCDAGACGQSFSAAGTVANATLQTAGDCQQVVCDGEGNMIGEPDDDDPSVDGLECTQDLCSDGTPSNPARPPGTACAAGECNSSGECTGCEQADDCGVADSCQAPTCNAQGVCGVVETPAGTALPGAEQVDGDCQQLQCDGDGAVASAADDDDVPDDDGNDCTDESCSGGLPQHPDEPVGTPCNDDGGSYCDGSGACVECIDAGDCPAADGCNVAVCEDHQCVVEPAEPGAPCSDGLFCTATDTCNASGQCVGTLDPCPGPDGDGDCSESCDETADACTADDEADSPCDDGLHCTTDDVCTAGSCGGAALECDPLETCFEACMGCAVLDCAE